MAFKKIKLYVCDNNVILEVIYHRGGGKAKPYLLSLPKPFKVIR
jgi:hypothetical protein